MNRLAQDVLWLSRVLVGAGCTLLALGFGFALGGAVGHFIAAAMVPGVAAVAFGAGLGLLILRDEKRRARDVDVVNLKALQKEMEDGMESGLYRAIREGLAAVRENDDRKGG